MQCFYLLLLLHITTGCRLEGNSKTLKQITAYTGDSVLLPCSCTDLHTKPQNFTWKKYINDWVQISPESEQYKHRLQHFNDHSSGNLSLLISHLTVEDGGDYTCGIEGENRLIRLTVEEAPIRPSPSTTTIQTTAKPEFSDLKTIIIIIRSGVVVVLLLMMILGGVKYRKHRRQRREQMSEGQTGQRTQQQNDSAVLYASFNRPPEDTKAEEKDDVMYSTVVHSDTHRPHALQWHQEILQYMPSSKLTNYNRNNNKN